MRTNIATLLAGLSTLAFAVPVFAQAPVPVDSAEVPTEIVVTARRRNERLIDVPASITVITAETLARTGVTDAAGFVQLTPGVTIVTGTAEAGDTQINIRGINGARDAESSVALVVDGILKTNIAQLNQQQGTLRQIEILKGPQGAIYGRNAAAGAIVVSTVKPGDRIEGAVRASYAEQNRSRDPLILQDRCRTRSASCCRRTTARPTGSIQTLFSIPRRSMTRKSTVSTGV
jgi:iron complex outermembrane receptor protein